MIRSGPLCTIIIYTKPSENHREVNGKAGHFAAADFDFYILHLIGKLNINNSISRGLIHAGPSKSFIIYPKLSGKHRGVDGKTFYLNEHTPADVIMPADVIPPRILGESCK